MQVDLALSVDIGDQLPFQTMYKDLSSLNYIETTLAPLPPIFSAQRRLAKKLECLNDQLHKDGQISEKQAFELQECLENLTSCIDSYDNNVDFVLRKIRSTTQLVRNTWL